MKHRKQYFDESFSEKELVLIDRVIENSLRSGKLVDAKDYFNE